MANELFDQIGNYFTKSRFPKIGDAKLQSNNFIIIRYLGLHRSTLVGAIETNELSMRLPKWAIPPYLFYTIPHHGKAPFIKYPKKEKKKVDKKYKELIEKMMAHYHCAEKYAHQIFDLLTVQGIDLYKSFGIGVQGKVPKPVKTKPKRSIDAFLKLK